MLLKSFYWLILHGERAIIPRSAILLSFFRAFLFLLFRSVLYFGDVFIHVVPWWLSTISYPMRTRETIAKYTRDVDIARQFSWPETNLFRSLSFVDL